VELDRDAALAFELVVVEHLSTHLSLIERAGAFQQAIGSYFAVKSAQYQAESQASSLEYRRTLSNMNARAAEVDAQLALRAGQQRAGQAGLQYRLIQSAARTQRAAGGIESGSGSAAEVEASINFAKESDQAAILTDSVRTANAMRLRGAGLRGQAGLDLVSANNLRGAAGDLRPGVAVTTSLLGSAGNVARNLAYQNRDARRYSG